MTRRPELMHLLTGATGYIGGRLLRRLEKDGLAVRCLCRNPEALGWRRSPRTELMRGDLLQPASLDAAFSGVDTAFYLVHSMNGGPEFETEERRAAHNFAVAARKAGVRRVVYLGGLGQEGEDRALEAKSLQDRRGIEAPAYDLDGHLTVVVAISPSSKVYRAHAAASELTLQHVLNRDHMLAGRLSKLEIGACAARR